jgi:hypothetical protein
MAGMQFRLAFLLIVLLILVIARALTKRTSSGVTLVVGNGFAAIVGGIVGCWIGFEAIRGKDAILPIGPFVGLVAGMLIGPAVFSSLWAGHRERPPR